MAVVLEASSEVGSISSAVARLRESSVTDAWRLSDTELREAVREVSALRGGVEAAYLALVGEMASRSGSAAAGLVREAAGVSSAAAARDVAAAVAIAPPGGAAPAGGPLAATAGVLSAFGDRLAAGSVSREHVDVAVRVLDGLPRGFLTDQGDRAAVAEILGGVVDGGAGPWELRRIGRAMLERLDPDGTRRVDPDADQRRFLDLGRDAYGMIIGSFRLDPVAGAQLKAAVAEFSTPAPARHPETGEVLQPDPRTSRQLRADALATIVELALGVSQPRRGERPRVVVHVKPEQLTGVCPHAATTEAGDVVSGPVLQRLACDAVVQRVVESESMGPLDVGRAERLVNLQQRRALAARDRGCVICGAPPDWCDAHHVIPWSHGGRSDLSNYALACPRHHTEIHNGHWRLEGDGDDLRIVPPKWVDPTRTPRRPILPMLERALDRLDESDRGDVDAIHSPPDVP